MSRNIALMISLVAIAAAVYLANLQPAYLPWHGTEQWTRLLNAYDRMSREVYGKKCEVLEIPTKYGLSRAYGCGKSSDPTVLLLHGSSSSSLMYGDFIAPGLVKNNFYAVPVDFPCEYGRSAPLNGDPKNCPATPEQNAEWVKEVADFLHPWRFFPWSA